MECDRAQDLQVTFEGGSEKVSVYKYIELAGTSTESWEQAAADAVGAASKTLRDLRIAEVVALDLQMTGESILYRAKLKLSFKYEGEN